MENNYQFRRNQREPDPEDIRRHMDFDALLQAHEASPMVAPTGGARIRRLYYALSVAAAMLLLLVVGQQWLGNNALPPNTADYLAKQPLRSAPLAELRASAEVQNVDAYQGGVIEYASGSRLVIPAGAFMNDRGRQVSGDVEVYYQEFHDFVDFFLAGVPMRYDSLGTERFLTSAGMVEVFAMQDGRRLRMASDKVIQVELVSDIYTTDFFTPPTYYVYQLDTAARNWAYRNIDIMQFVEEEDMPSLDAQSPEWQWRRQMADLDSDYEQAVQSLMDIYAIPSAPILPTQADGVLETLELDFQGGQLALDPSSALSAADVERLHQGTIWEILPESPEVNPNAFQVNWERVALRKRNNGTYELTLIHSQNSETLLVRPVLMGEDFAQATSDYEAELAAYEVAVTEREAQLSAGRDSLRIVFQARKDALEASFRDQLQQRNDRLKRQVVNRFVISDFGLWNCAQPIEQSSVVQSVSYQAASGEPITESLAYVASEQYNTLFRYYADQEGELGLEPGLPNLVWMVRDGKLWLTEVSQLDEEGALIMEEQSTPDSEEALRKLLQL